MKNIYDDFSDEIVWIKERILEDSLALPESVKAVAQYYSSKRILVFLNKEQQTIMIDPELGRPIPYVVFWFAEALGLTDKNVAKKLALGLLYATLAYVILDDIIDEENNPSLLNITLSNIYLYNYLAAFDNLFDTTSSFWHYLADSLKQFMNNLSEDFTFKHEDHNILGIDPFSKQFLFRSCRSYSVLVMTILVAIAYSTKNEVKIPMIEQFWRNYAMAHRLHDDLNDWQEDLKMEDLNHSPILIYALQTYGEELKLSEEEVLGMFLRDDFVNKIYGVILDMVKAAKEDASTFNGVYLSRYMDEQVMFHTKNRNGLLRTNSSFQSELSSILKKESS